MWKCFERRARKLVRHVLLQGAGRLRLDSVLDELGKQRTLGEELLTPTRIYVKPLLALMREVRVKGMAHITDGGLVENVPRMLPGNCKAVISSSTWRLPPLFQWLQREGNIADGEMHRVFNCGIGMAIVVAAADADASMKFLVAQGETVYRIGAVHARRIDEPQTAGV